MKPLYYIVFILILVAISGCTDTNTTPVVNNTSHTIASDNLTAYFIDVGQGDSIILQCSNRTMLIDAGEQEYGDDVVNFTKSKGIDHFNYAVATHPHADHIGGMRTVLTSITVDHFIDSGDLHPTETYHKMLATVSDKDIPLETPKRSDLIDFAPGIHVEVVNPGHESTGDDRNHNSVALIVEDKDVRFLFMGDADAEAESEILASGFRANVDVLKVGHHGSSTASSQAFLDIVDPEVSIIEVGANNVYNHPNADVLKRLQDTSQVYRTDEDGTITVTTDGSAYSVTTEK
jgi:beta-lactamase superfamily II metal-dependent hydrolase